MMVAALELMTIINTKMIYECQNSTPKFEPDLTQLAVSGRQADTLRKLLAAYGDNVKPSAKALPMKLKTQQLFEQNQERVKQAMLVGLDPKAVLFPKKETTSVKKRSILEITRPDLKTPGKFRFKFHEGHSKNFKRELRFDWFLEN